MTETVFEKLAAAVSVLKLDFSSEEFALYAEEHELSEADCSSGERLYPPQREEAADHRTYPAQDESLTHQVTEDI